MLNEEQKRLAEAKELISSLYECAKEKLGFDRDAKITFLINEENANNPLGKTGYYNPSNNKISIYITGRHIKDIMRSLAHEIIHHSQNCNGEFKDSGPTQEGYAQRDSHLRKMEEEAYRVGNMLFRDFCDNIEHGDKNEFK